MGIEEIIKLLHETAGYLRMEYWHRNDERMVSRSEKLDAAAFALSERGDSGARWVAVADEIANSRIQEVAALLPIYTLHRRQWYRLDGLKEPK